MTKKQPTKKDYTGLTTPIKPGEIPILTKKIPKVQVFPEV